MEIYSLSREDVVRRGHQFFQHIKGEGGLIGGLSSAGIIQQIKSDDAINQAIEQSIKWDVFKRQAVCNALREKRAKFLARQRNLKNWNNDKPSVVSQTKWIEELGDGNQRGEDPNTLENLRTETEGKLAPLKPRRSNVKLHLKRHSQRGHGLSQRGHRATHKGPLEMSYLGLLESQVESKPRSVPQASICSASATC
jgi:hypothetical protein